MGRVVAHIDPYTLGDSEAGIVLAALRGSLGVDLNARTCRANTWRPWRRRRRLVFIHWSEWWKHGYEPKPGTRVPRRKVERLRLRQVRNLRSVHGHHEVMTDTHALIACHHHGEIPCVEMKPSIWPAHVLEHLRSLSDHLGTPVLVMTIQRYGKTARAQRRWEAKAYQRMADAHQVGLPTMLLYRGDVDWQKWSPVLTAVKGHRAHGTVVDAQTLLTRLHKEARGAA